MIRFVGRSTNHSYLRLKYVAYEIAATRFCACCFCHRFGPAGPKSRLRRYPLQTTGVYFGEKTTLPYAPATNHLGQPVTLSMDVYEPEGDTAAMRPVIVLEHGGSFAFGNKSDMARWGEFLAKRGYVAASIQYRLFPIFPLGIPDSTEIMDTAVKAVGDMKAAVRYFREDAATANLFRADPDHIFVGGYSAGAVAALHAAYLDENDDIPAFMQTIIANNGGFNGNSGSASNQTYSSEIGAVINMSGGIYRRGWINADEPPMAGIHGTADGTVPYLTGVAANIAYLEGSGVLHPYALSAGPWTYLKTIPGGGHGNIYDQAAYAAPLDNYWMRATTLLEHLTCYVDTLPEKTSSTRPEKAHIAWSVFPNPVQYDRCTVLLPDFAGTATLLVYDQRGREVLRVDNIRQGRQVISVAGLAPGVYTALLLEANGTREISGGVQLLRM
ncbi:MAG: carboxylesterase family protein [Lewinellaceae bacterium]|nr:carboxylesterase family protein [Lewinellaceae bacterium]